MTTNKYTMKMSLNVLNHLGLNLYSNIPTVLSEIVANAYDADATKVTIDLDIKNDKIIIEDDGNGMTLEEINKKFLLVGYSKRKSGNEKSMVFRRDVMGRKGIGKLSLFSIANQVDVYTAKVNKISGVVEKNGLGMNRHDIESEIQSSEVYHPKDLSTEIFQKEKGTMIVITNFKRKINHWESYLRTRLARRFSVLGDKYKFNVSINETQITANDRNYLKKVPISLGNRRR